MMGSFFMVFNSIFCARCLLPRSARRRSRRTRSADTRGLLPFFSAIRSHLRVGRVSESDKQAIDGVAAGGGEPGKEKIINHGHGEVYGCRSWRLRLIVDPFDRVFLSNPKSSRFERRHTSKQVPEPRLSFARQAGEP